MAKTSPKRDDWEQIPVLLGMLASGSISIKIDGDPLVSVNADRKDIDVQVAPLRDHAGDLGSVASGGGMDLLRSAGVPFALARDEWRVSIRDGDRPLIDIGRGTSSLTGHVRVHLAAVDELRRLF